ncbi:MAG: LysM peptidoglycan-binding domain-containing protein, partial [Lachnospiraceae bacterium]
AAGEYEVKAGVNLKCMLCIMKEMEYITDVDFEEQQGKRRKQITCYYVKEGDTLFDIGRKYRVKQEDILKWNSDVSLKNGSRIYMYTATEPK